MAELAELNEAAALTTRAHQTLPRKTELVNADALMLEARVAKLSRSWALHEPAGLWSTHRLLNGPGPS